MGQSCWLHNHIYDMEVLVTKLWFHLVLSRPYWPLILYFRSSGQPQNVITSGDKAFEDWLNDDLGSYQG